MLQTKFVRIAKKLKKNNVAVDIVSFGSEEENADKLEAFLEAVNSGDNSHLVTVPAGTVLSDSLFGSPVFQVCHCTASQDSSIFAQHPCITHLMLSATITCMLVLLPICCGRVTGKEALMKEGQLQAFKCILASMQC